MPTYYHKSPDGKKRRCKNPATCKFKPTPTTNPAPSNGLSIPESFTGDKKRQVRQLYSSGFGVNIVSSVDSVINPNPEAPQQNVDNLHSEIDFFTEEVVADRESLLEMNPFKRS